MPRPTRSIQLSLPADVTTDTVFAAVGRGMSVEPDAPRSDDRVYLDTFDGLLRAAGMSAWRRTVSGSRSAVPASVNVVTADGDAWSFAANPSRRDRILLDDLDDLGDGRGREAVARVMGERALLSQARVRSHLHAAAVCNNDGKTVVRLVIEEPTLVTKSSSVALARRLRVTSVLGYDAVFDRVVDLLRNEVVLDDALGSIVDDATMAAGLPVGGTSSKIDVGLAPNMRADHATVLICQRLADVVDANLPGVLADIDPEFLHDLRVAVRRTRSILKEMKHVLPKGPAEHVKAEMRWIQAITGPTRDLDVQLHEWMAMVRGLSPTMAADLPSLYELLQRHRAAAFVKMRRQLKGTRYKETWPAWRALLDDVMRGDGGNQPPNAAAPVVEIAGGRIWTVYKGMVELGSRIGDDSAAEMLHDLRKRGKELRYLLELYGQLWPQDAVKPLVAALKGLQDVLGRFQDGQIQTAYLRDLGPELAATPGGTDSLIALGRVIDALAVDQHEARKDFQKRFEPFAGRRTRADVRGAFRRPAPGGAT